jgi:hypothetical protein
VLLATASSWSPIARNWLAMDFRSASDSAGLLACTVSSLTWIISSPASASAFSCRPRRLCTRSALAAYWPRAATARSSLTAVPAATGSSLALTSFWPVASCSCSLFMLACLPSMVCSEAL